MMQLANKTQQILYWNTTRTQLIISVVDFLQDPQSNVRSGINTDVTDNNSNNHGVNTITNEKTSKRTTSYKNNDKIIVHRDNYDSNLIKGTSTDTFRCFGKYCSCEQACQFSALQGTPWWSYLENLTIDDKFINKRVRLYTLNDVSRRKNYFYVITRLRNSCLVTFLKKIQKQPPKVQRQSPDVLYKKTCF